MKCLPKLTENEFWNGDFRTLGEQSPKTFQEKFCISRS